MAGVAEAVGKARLSATMKLASRVVPASGLVLEVGATDASFRPYVQHREWLTIDKYGEPDLVADLDGPSASVPLPDATVDAIFCTEVLEHLVAGSALVREMARVLRPSGVAIVSVPNMVSAKALTFSLMGRVSSMAASGDCGPPLGGTGIMSEDGWVAGHVVDFDRRRLVRYLERGGLHVFDRQSVPLSLGVPPRDRIVLPWTPRRFGDYLLVAARPGPTAHPGGHAGHVAQGAPGDQ